jgi:hypothetical protein
VRHRALRSSPAPFNVVDRDPNQAALLNPTILHFSRAGSAFKALVFAIMTVAAFSLAFALLDERNDRALTTQVLPGGLVLPTPAPRPDPFLVLKIPLLLGAGAVSLFYVGRYAKRAFTRAVAIKIEGGRLHFHPSFGAMPDQLPVDYIDAAIFDRADRLPETAGLAMLGIGSSAAKFGARTRHGLYLHYRSGSTSGEARVIDNDVEGGTEQLRRFAAQVDIWRRAHTRADR